MGALKALVSFYTIFHMNITQDDMDSMEKKFYLTPLVGLVFGFMALLAISILDFLEIRFGFGNVLVMAVILLLIPYVGSKFLHFDGLTDFGDGMIVSGEQSDHIRALKDTLVGAGGIGVALITVLCSFACYTMYDARASAILLLPAVEILVKNAMVVAASFGKPGNGMAARQVEKTTGKSAVLGCIVTIAAVLLLFVVTGSILMLVPASFSWEGMLMLWAPPIVAGFIVSIIVGFIMARTANRVFGMVNGDILGATNEVARPFLLFFMILAFAMVTEML
ncbi:MAG: hypothetical protein E7Z70_01345 [Thermoplasmata archaeon]|nr:hypothetical protein [Thermoplasmata archaeon]